MIRDKPFGCALLLALGVLLASSGCAQQPQVSKPAKSPSKAAAPAVELVLEPKAIDLLKTSSRRLAAARSMSFTAAVSYESPSRPGPALVYTMRYDVTLQRPNKLRVITPGDGPSSEFYYNGKTMVSFAPDKNLVAIAEAPPTIDATLKAAHDSAAIYYPFTDLIVADPYKAIADRLEFAFYIGQSRLVGGTTTDMVAYASDGVFVQIWIGAEDKLPRRTRAVYRDDPSQLRHQMDLSNWQLDGAVPANTFASSSVSSAKRIPFARPDPKLAPAAQPPAGGAPSQTQ
ncbi:MAG: DUF2092 domain-containing protein [Acidobacteria bacterium]|nr:DUF2092 domain-containing protein [Acidobacteriota bacterium]